MNRALVTKISNYLSNQPWFGVGSAYVAAKSKASLCVMLGRRQDFKLNERNEL